MPPPADRTDSYHPGEPGPPARATTVPPAERQAVELIAGHAPDADDALLALIRSRLRQALVLFLAGYLLFIARDLFTGDRSWARFQLRFLAGTAAAQLGLIALSRTRLFAGRAAIRGFEAANLGLFALSAGGIQFQSLADPGDIEQFLNTGSSDMQVLVANTWMMPWFAVIAGYPVLVPNRWRRTAGIVGLTALVPPAVLAAAMAVNPTLTTDRAWWMFTQFAIWGLIGGAIAVYGAAQAGWLRAEAFAARRFGQYVLRHKLGGGGMGDVYLAEHTLLKRPSVIKLVRPDRAADPKVLARFAREVRILATLTHWNTVAVYDYGYTRDGTFYFVMEYLPGLNLDDLVTRHGPVPPGRAVHLARQICHGLREAHAAGLIHRDVKPSNVMACERGGVADVAKLLDFGLVQGPADPADTRLTREGTLLGTPAYMSPEQAAGTAADARSDLYSLGATVYFLLTGRPPFVKKTMVETLAAHLAEPVTPPRGVNPAVPPDLDAVVAKCLAKEPAARFADAAALERALAGCDCAAAWDCDAAAGWWRERN